MTFVGDWMDQKIGFGEEMLPSDVVNHTKFLCIENEIKKIFFVPILSTASAFYNKRKRVSKWKRGIPKKGPRTRIILPDDE